MMDFSGIARRHSAYAEPGCVEGRVFSNEELQQMLPHIFLPRKLPGSTSPTLVQDEANLLRIMKHNVVEIIEATSGQIRCLHQIANVYNTWWDIQREELLSSEKISHAMKCLRPGDSFALYVRAQNAGLLIAIPDDQIHESNIAILSTFPAASRSEDIMSTTGDLCTTCPTATIHIPVSDLMKSEALGRQLRALCYTQCDIAMPKTRKAGSSHSEIRDVPDPMLVSKLITALLTNASSDVCSHFKKLCKKVKDQVNWETGSKLPFRRSGLWFTAKVILQLLLVNGLGESDGTFVYKLILLRILLYFSNCYKHINADISMQIAAKMAHRLCKLESYLKHNDVSQVHVMTYHILKRPFYESIKMIHDEMETRWKKIINMDSAEAKLDSLNGLNIVNDTKHQLRRCRPYLQSRRASPPTVKSLVPVPKCPPRHRLDLGAVGFPLYYFQTDGEEDLGIVLCDFEQFVRKHLLSYTSIYNCCEVRMLLETYVNNAKRYYANDPVGGSQMVLASLKIIQVLDTVATKAQPLLLNHRSGIDIDIVKDLLLVKSEDLKEAHDLEIYFNSRNRSPYPSLIEEEEVSNCSFSVIFSTNNIEMCTIKNEILAEAERKIQMKKTEVHTARITVAELERRANEMSHTYYTQYDEWKCSREIHSSCCTKCSLESQARNYRVEVYERPLPSSAVEQAAVIFELRIPQEIACLRDALYYFRTKVCSTNMQTNSSWVDLWKSYNEICRYNQGKQQYINLGSTTKLFKNTNYNSLHPSSSDDRFIVNNGYNCRFAAESNCLCCPDKATVKNYCTFRLSDESKYKALEWTIPYTTHSQNQVLAEQANCPMDLALSEFKEFGSLRAGHRLQLRNIYRALQQDTLSFHEEPVFSLICQSIWQAEPQVTPPLICRESHLDLMDLHFATILLKLLEKVLNQQSKNWMSYYTMMNVIVLTARVLSLTPDEGVKKVSLGILRQCRSVTNEWKTKVEQVLKEMKEASKEKVKKLRMTYIYINICSVLTFWVDETDFPLVMTSSEDVECWLASIAKVKDNIILSTAGLNSLPTSLRNLLRWIRCTGVRMENHMHSVLCCNNNGFKHFAKSHLPGSENGIMGVWISCEGLAKQVYQSQFVSDNGNELTLHMDIIRGDFLVNGSPVGFLPTSITSHTEFQRVFNDTIFEVTPGEAGSLVTKYEDRSYSFLLCRENSLIVTETQNGSKSELVPYEVFKGDVPYLLENYSHWWNKIEHTISFRPKQFQHKGFLDKVSYILDLNKSSLMEKPSRKLLVDINSQSYLSVCKVMDRLEHRNYVQILHNSEDSHTTVELPRLALQFEIDHDGQLKSREYPGMKVKAEQKFGTFVGLKQGLLLESIDIPDTSNPVLLIPHGTVNITSALFHQSVYIGLTTLRTPEFFAFEIDERLRQLRAGQSHTGWLFLSLLHAVTASPMPDPFTGLTGTESAFQLLQSAHCWSSQPLDKEARGTLTAIAKLSPHRTYYPEHLKCMENIQWPEGLSSLPAHDGYQIIAKKLIDDSQRLAFLHVYASHSSNEYNNVLAQKSYWRHHCFYTEQAHCSPEFNLQFQASPTSSTASLFERNLDGDAMISVRTMAHLGYVWSTVLPPASRYGYLKQLLVAENTTLTGVRNETFYPVDSISVLNLNFKESWLDLYNFARCVKANQYECEWSILLCVLAFTGTSLAQLQILHNIAVNPGYFSHLDPPPHPTYYEVSNSEFDDLRISTIFRQWKTSLNEYISRTNQERKLYEEEYAYSQRKRSIEREHDSLINSQVEQLSRAVAAMWPTKAVSSLQINICSSEINVHSALIQVNSNLNIWHMNRELKLFLEQVEKITFNLTHSTTNSRLGLQNALTQCSNVTLNKTQQYKFSELILCKLLTVNGNNSIAFLGKLQDISNLSTDSTTSAEVEKIFITGQTHLWSIEQIPSQELIPVINIPPFPWTGKAVSCDESCQIEKDYMNDLKRSWKAHYKFPHLNIHLDDRIIQQLQQVYSDTSLYAKFIWEKALKRAFDLNKTFSMEVLMAAGLFPRLIPSTLLPLLCNQQLDNQLRNFVGAAAVVWTYQQQANRCLKFAKAGESMEVELKKELATSYLKPKWSPKEKPEWLLLELELDFKIRPVQVQVANAMLYPEDGKHALMQLNMGEGKTAVIIPLVASLLANEKQLCRVTVLKSLFHMNRDALMQKMGGLLNQRIYVFPCRRDMTIGCREAKILHGIYEECVSKRGIVLTLPEYRLSFQLKGYEHSRKKSFVDARSLLILQQWLKENARDVLDESDAILHVKYQLIYTIGDQISIDGESLRWTVPQSLLKLVPSRLSQLIRKYGHNIAECNDSTNNPERFPHCRLLNLKWYVELCEMLSDDILKGKLEIEFPDLQATDRDLIFSFLSSAVISRQQHNRATKIFSAETNTRNRDVLLILRGLLACGVLSLVLNKRWRVNYGINPNGYRLMAVPFRAKDIAAERTEFGHPDVAILSTILSYYYSGLNGRQLDQCFELLYRQQNCEQEYAHWVSKVRDIHPSIENLSGVNLADYGQRENILKPALLKNMAVIDFWLGKVVFPRESKQFEHKMLCSPWDLSADDVTHPVTGFSGTNDTKLLLPINISQNDLPELLGTNGKVLHNLLLYENNNYACLSSSMTNTDILQKLVKQNIPLLLDVGALMTEYSNKDVAWKWLNLTQTTQKNAAIYFDEDDRLVVLGRQRRPCLFEVSPYRRRMEECVIYLDDFHTRGTDLKIPRGTKGCVTLGKGVTKDKLVQGCMRMRMLGEGHTVQFLASTEVHGEIQTLTGKSETDIGAKDVLSWAIENSRLATRDGFLHWVAAGSNYNTKKTAHRLFDKSDKSDDAIHTLGEYCTDKEVTKLVRMYGTFSQEEIYPTIARSFLKAQQTRFQQSDIQFSELPEQILKSCHRYVPTHTRLAHLLDEEQERELEHELEEEREKERPPPAKPIQSHLAKEVVTFLRHGIRHPGDWLMSLPRALQNTTFWPDVQPECWGQNIFATKDFVKVVEIHNQNDCVDPFLRPVSWLAALKLNNGEALILLLSPYEVNKLMPMFRSSRAVAVLHMYAARLRSDQDTLLQCPQLAVPSTDTPVIYPNFGAINANLSLFSGNMYFADEKEQDDYSRFIGFIARPRTDAEQQLFDSNGTYSGFVKPQFRNCIPYITSEFVNNPDLLIRNIIAARFDYFPSRCHISRLIVALRKPLSQETGDA